MDSLIPRLRVPISVIDTVADLDVGLYIDQFQNLEVNFLDVFSLGT